MNASFIRLVLSILVALVLFPGQVSGQAALPEQALERLRATYDAIESLRAEFRQAMTYPFDDAEVVSTGVLYLKGDRYRVETETQTFVTNGQVTWIYNIPEQQVLINDYVDDEMTFSVNDFLFDRNAQFEVHAVDAAVRDGADHLQLHLRPRTADAFFREATLWLRERDDLVTRIDVTDVNDTRIRFELEDIALDAPLPPDLFRFTPPAEAEVIDLRS